ncbi:MAG: LTA synthase family protein [Lachnospiraceae bacterium]|nr:LTA synthase family protein [Lachnospiraceae bacterium]
MRGKQQTQEQSDIRSDMRAWRERRRENRERRRATPVGRAVCWIILVGYPVILFYVTAYMTYDPFARTGGWAQFMNVALLEGFVWLLTALTGSTVIALRTELVLGTVIILANYYVLSFRGSPIVPWDFVSLGTAAEVAGGYSYALPLRQILLLVVLLFMIWSAGLARVNIPLTKREGQKRQPVRKNIVIRLAALVLSLVCLGGVTHLVQDDVWVGKLRLYPFLFTPTAMYERNGFFVTFLMDMQYMAVEKPEGYSPEQAQKILDAYEGADWVQMAEEDGGVPDESVTGGDAAQERFPNVIVIMDEAFSDLRVLNGGQELPVSRDATPFLHRMQAGMENTITGSLAVSVKGGNTANTEFEFLTGQTMAFLPAGCIPYQQYVKGDIPALGHYMQRLGYDTYGMHPYYPSGWNRDTVYPYLGFQTFLSRQDYGNASHVRGYVDDSSAVEQVIDLYEKRRTAGKENPFFCFQVTMQNHSPYTDEWEAPGGNIAWQGEGTSYGTAQLEEYLTLMELSDRALEELITYFAGVEEPTVVVFFGDHQPTDSVVEPVWNIQGKRGSDLSDEENMLRYEVPYVIWANYDIPEADGWNLSANYLAACMMEVSGIPLTDYQNYLLELQREIPVISSQHQDRDTEGFRDYQKLQYYLLFDAAGQRRK